MCYLEYLQEQRHLLPVWYLHIVKVLGLRGARWVVGVGLMRDGWGKVELMRWGWSRWRW